MPSRDLAHSISVQPGIPTTAVTSGNTATTQSAGTDTFGYESVTLAVLITARTDGTYTPKVQDCATSGGSYADLDPSEYMGGAVPGALNATGTFLYGLKDGQAGTAPNTNNGVQRFVKAVVTQAGGTSGATFAAVWILGHPHHRNAAV